MVRREPLCTAWRTERSSSSKVSGGGEDGAYAVWLSEVMLQQTRVQAVIPYYDRWMDKRLTVRHLAAASQGKSMKRGQVSDTTRECGISLRVPRAIAKGAEFPRTAAALRGVRGIGDYTTGAIASIAFDEAVPAVDGNVVRVIT